MEVIKKRMREWLITLSLVACAVIAVTIAYEKSISYELIVWQIYVVFLFSVTYIGLDLCVIGMRKIIRTMENRDRHL